MSKKYNFADILRKGRAPTEIGLNRLKDELQPTELISNQIASQEKMKNLYLDELKKRKIYYNLEK